MIKVVSFDIGGTLLQFDNSKTDKYSLDNLASLIPSCEFKTVRKAYKDVYQKNKGTFDELYEMFCKKLEIEKNIEVETFLKEKFSSVEDSIVNPSAIEVMKTLKDKGYKIICLSNSNVLIKNEELNELKQYIDKIYYSYDLGYTKNENEIYDIIENDLGYKEEEFLHIGDTMSADYEKPIENGWNALYFGNTNLEGIKKINDLKDIFLYL